MSPSRADGGPRGAPRVYLAIEREEEIALAPDDDWFERIAATVLDPVGRAGSVEASLLLAGDATLHRLNRDYRRMDKPTDVLSFPQHEGDVASLVPPGDRPLHLGDVAISVERARRQAADYGHSVERELGYLFVHGLLHLLGYDHEASEDQARMRTAEESALAALGLTREPGMGAATAAAHAIEPGAAT